MATPNDGSADAGKLCRWRDEATGDVEEVDFAEWSRRELERIRERGGRCGTGGVVVGCQTHRLDGSIVRTERSMTLDDLRSEHRGYEAAKAECAQARCEGLRIMATDRARGAAIVLAASRRARDDYLGRRRRADRDATRTIVRPPTKPAATRSSTTSAGGPVRVSARTTPRGRERRRTDRSGCRSSSSSDDSSPEPGAGLEPAATCRCGCGDQAAPGRSYVNDAHANRAYARKSMRLRRERERAAGPALDTASVLDRVELLIIAEIAAGRLDFFRALDWLTDPVGCRKAVAA